MKFRVKFLFLAALLFALSVPSITSAQIYIQTNLVSNVSGLAATTDPLLKNPWGLARSTTSPWWVSDNATGVATIYSLTGGKVPPAVTVPAPPTGAPPSAPTGMVFNGSAADFLLAPLMSAKFIFATEDGTISGWNSGATAVIKVDKSAEGAVYKGITTGDVNGVRYLYVTNFHSGHVEVYDTNFNPVKFHHDRDDYDRDDHDRDADRDHHDHSSEGSFDDDSIPWGFAPFNIQNIGGSLFVTYAKQDGARHDDVAGDGNGYVDIYSTTGKLQARLQHGPWLNSPWGVVWAPRDFGEFSNRVLVGNFGSGKIAAFNGFDGKFIGLMNTFVDPKALTGSQTLVIDGLWALAFGNSGGAGAYNSLFFTAGPNSEQNGLFGSLTAASTDQDGDEE